ncbi:MAG TPA: hypothetical protein VG125_15425 [Pirellulales bacterium]|jgi:hypothetical protein|nr:hypothetical protein [Pirellulales bacterium]
MSERFLERLSRFTPDAGGLDRDSLLFAAGRASARPNRGWKCLSAVLATTQLLALAVLWPQAGGVAPNGTGSLAQATPQRTAELAPSQSPATSGVWSIRHDPNEIKFDERLAGNLEAGELALVESEPILRAFGPLPASVVN